MLPLTNDAHTKNYSYRLVAVLAALLNCVEAIHHMLVPPPPTALRRRDVNRPLRVSNSCPETIYPAIATQAGVGPTVQGFKLGVGQVKLLTVSADWQGRLWARTNCSFNSDGTGPAVDGGGTACETGDCGGIVDCRGSGQTPVSLAEFTLSSSSGQTFYDISLVDGYNVPLGIQALDSESGDAALTQIPPNLTNPVCIATAALLAVQGKTDDLHFGSNASFPLPLDQTQSSSQVQRWCPWNLQMNPPSGPTSGVYNYPDGSVERPLFNPCYSACAKTNAPSDCCTGAYGSPSTCKPSYYSQQAKMVCPDAYSYAFDDQTSTFIIPSGNGFAVVFCPAGRSTTILTTMSSELHKLAQTGQVSRRSSLPDQAETCTSPGTDRHEHPETPLPENEKEKAVSGTNNASKLAERIVLRISGLAVSVLVGFILG